MDSSAITAVLKQATQADGEAIERLLPLVYDELKHLARGRLVGERAGHTLCATALVHEAWFKLVDHAAVGSRGRAYFFGAAARAMRQVLVDHARARQSEKRGAGAPHQTLVTAVAGDTTGGVEVLALHEALERLRGFDRRQADVVELRFFGGLGVDETAALLEVSPRTVKGDWAMARAWLYRELEGPALDAPE